MQRSAKDLALRGMKHATTTRMCKTIGVLGFYYWDPLDLFPNRSKFCVSTVSNALTLQDSLCRVQASKTRTPFGSKVGWCSAGAKRAKAGLRERNRHGK